MDLLTASDTRNILIAVCDCIIESKQFLTEIDNATGDGDHGIGMASGMKKAKEKLLAAEYNDVYAVFSTMGKTMLMSMGGASGVIFGSMFLAGAKDQAPKAAITAMEFAQLMERSLAAIKERGKAQPGDKTMVDALEPAVQALGLKAEEGYPAMLEAAVHAAQQGVENTKNCLAKFGRAKTLGERAIGHQDPGATSVWLIFRAMHEVVAKHNN